MKIAFALVILALIARFAVGIDWTLLGARMTTADAPLVALTAALLIGRLLSWHLRWSVTLHQAGDTTPAGRRLAILLASVVTNHVVPSMRLAGGLLRARYISRASLGFGEAYATVLFDTTMHHATSGIFTWVTLIGAAWVLGYRAAAALLLIGGSALIAYVAVRLRRDDPLDGVIRRYVHRLRESGRLDALVHRGRNLAAMIHLLASRRVLWFRVPLWSVVWMTTSVAAQWTLFISLGVDVGFWTAAVSIGLGVLATVLTQTPGGIGSTEAAMVAAYAAFGVDQVDALAGTLLYRGIHYALVLGLGLPSLLYCELAHAEGDASVAPP